MDMSDNLTYNRNVSSEYYNVSDIYDYDIDITHILYIYLWTIITPILFAIIIFIGFTGNIMVIFVILSKPKMRTTTNILLLNLAIADIAFLLICVPFQADKYASFDWKHGKWVCQIVQYSLYVTACVTVWTLASIAVMRYMTVVWSANTAQYRTKNNVVVLCIFLWIILVFANIPVLLAHQINTTPDLGYTYCGSDPASTKTLILTFFVFAYALPLFLICVLYILIICHLQANRASMISVRSHSHSKSRTTRACKTIIIVVIVFGISWLPLHIISLLGLYGKVPGGFVFEVFRIIANCMAYGNSLANPFIYNYASEEFRKAFKEICSSNCCNKNHASRLSVKSFRTATYRMTEIEQN